MAPTARSRRFGRIGGPSSPRQVGLVGLASAHPLAAVLVDTRHQQRHHTTRMKAVVVLLTATVFAAVAALGQGQFFFATHVPDARDAVRSTNRLVVP
jgi:hypothetical protein